MTVGSGFSPDLLDPARELASARGLIQRACYKTSISEVEFTAGGEFHPALKTYPYATAFADYRQAEATLIILIIWKSFDI